MEMKICKSCGYVVISQMQKCPNCDAAIGSQKKKIAEPIVDDYVEDEVIEQPIIAPAQGGAVRHLCTLRPLAFEGEREIPARTHEGEVQLSRSNTMPTDASIDADIQAKMFYDEESDAWYIQDECDERSTFVHAYNPIKLSDGDIIKMGDREFEFNIKEM